MMVVEEEHASILNQKVFDFRQRAFVGNPLVYVIPRFELLLFSRSSQKTEHGKPAQTMSRALVFSCHRIGISARRVEPTFVNVRHFVRSPIAREDVENPNASSSSVESSLPVIPSSRIFPNVMKPEPLYDSAFTTVTRGRRSGRHSRVTVRNDPAYQTDKAIAAILDKPANDEEEKNAMKMLPLSSEDQEKLHKYPILTRRVTQQTGKGKKHRQYMLMVVGNGDGLVGYGEGKHEDFGATQDRALIEAIRNMDYVERFEKRTIWSEMSIKLGSTRILMRPRPVGFGLHCNPNIHQVLKAAGIKDVSAKVWGSRNPINVVKATCMLIQAGNAPLSMGNGIGGKGRRLDAGSGMRSREVMEMERGRKLMEGRTW